MKHSVLAILQIGLLLAFPVLAAAQQSLLSDPEIYEKEHFRKRCAAAEFGDGFIKRQDVNNDKIIDAVVNEGELTCDGKKGPDCNDDGCPFNIYLQAKEGGYIMIATAQMYGYDFIQRFGNMVLVMKMHPRFCNRTDAEPCLMTVRIRGTKLVTISAK